ncbi:hypothetical protein FW784_14150, partial [Lysobacter lacus]
MKFPGRSVASSLAFFAILFVSSTVGNAAYAQQASGHYGAPYYHHGYDNKGPFPTVDEAIDAWWADWKRVWVGYEFCGYDLTRTDPNANDGWAASMMLRSPCSGGNGVSATFYPDPPPPPPPPPPPQPGLGPCDGNCGVMTGG